MDQIKKDILCIYHGNCADGFGAAWVVRSKFGEENVEFYPGVYQSPPPDCTGRNVWMVDFSYKRPVILEMAKVARNIVIIDHHKTAQEDLIDLPQNVIVYFDTTHSGAMLTWIHCYGFDEPPELLLHIEDRDLWKFNKPFTREIQANVFSYPYNFKAWDELMNKDPMLLAQEGAAIERKHHKDIAELVNVVTRPMRIGGIVMQVANLPYTLTSDAGHLLAKKHDCGVAGCYWDTPEGRVFSLRSTEDGLDVAEIAKQYGGGGHKNASGFRISFEQAQEFEITQ